MRTFRVIDKATGERADTENIVRNEIWAHHLIVPDIDGFVLHEDGTLMLIDDCAGISYPPEGRFEIVWDTSESITGASVTLGEAREEP